MYKVLIMIFDTSSMSTVPVPKMIDNYLPIPVPVVDKYINTVQYTVVQYFINVIFI